MSRQMKNLLIAVVALVVTVAGVWGVLTWLPDKTPDPDTDTTTTTTAAPDIVIMDKRRDANKTIVTAPVLTVDIQNRQDVFQIATDDDGTMAVTAYRDLPVDATAIKTLCDTLAYLTATSKPAANEDDAAYGFAEPTATVKATFHDGSVETILFGNATQGSEGYYCRREGDDTLYITDKTLSEQFMTDGLSFIGKTLIAPPSPNADDTAGKASLFRLWLTGTCREQPIEIVTDTDGSYPALTYMSTFYIRSPYLRSVDSDKFFTMSGTMTSLVAAGVEAAHPDAAALEAYGLTDPHSIAAFTLAVTATASGENGGSVTSHYNDREHMVMLGGKNEDGRYYALVDGLDIVYLLDPASVPWAELSYVDVVSKLLFMKDITTVDTLAVTDHGQKTTFELAHFPQKTERNDQLIVKADGKTYDTADFRSLYALMLSIHKVDDKEPGATIAGEPVLKWELTFNDGTAPMTLSLYEMTASRFLCVADDGEQTAVSISDAEEFLKQYRRYLNGEAVVTPY